MDIKDQLNSDVITAMKSGDKGTTETLRGLKSAIKYAEIDVAHELDNEEILALIAKQAKQRRDSIAEFEKAGRTDLVEKEATELALLEKYLPAQMSETEIEKIAQAAITELGITDMKGMGQVMQHVMADLKGQADGKVVNQIVRKLLSN